MAKKQARKAKKPTKRAAKKPVAKARKAARPAKRHAPRKAVKAKAAARKAARPKAVKKAVRKVAKAVKKIARPIAKKATAAKPKAKPAAKPAVAAKKAAVVHPPTLERKRLQLPEAERLAGQNPTPEARTARAARSGGAEMKAKQKQHTETSPVLTGGDVDADWQDAYATGDESPGGDNPTPDQNVVADNAKALGVEYQDGEELEGGDEIAERDDHRWELDPESSDDWPHKE